MKKIIFGVLVLSLSLLHNLSAQVMIGTQAVDTATIIGKLHVPWEILWGPDDHIWFTERNGQVRRLNPVTKTSKIILKMTDVVQQSESGLLGMALHPNFNDSAFVYLVYNYLSSSVIKERLVRYTYSSDTLTDRIVLLDNVSGNGNHNGSRLLITPDRKILMTTGDAQNTSVSQNNASISGKILRLNLDGSIPADNPVSGRLFWSKGHRNAQGIVLGPNGILYSSEHGPNNDDELNIIKKGGNYGWPTVEGFCNAPTEIQFCQDSNAVEPIYAWTPTLAVAGIDYYNSTAIQEWNKCILMTTLKEADLRVLQLNAAGDSVIKSTTYFNNWFGRLRDVCVAPNGDVYIATSNRDGRAVSPFPRPIDDRIIKITPATISGSPIINSKKKEINLSPNPLSEQTLITITHAGNEDYDFKVYNLLGEEIQQIRMKGNSPAVFYRNQLPKGMYLYRVFSEDKLVANGKFVIN